MVVMPKEKRIKLVIETMDKLADVMKDVDKEEEEDVAIAAMAVIEDCINKAYDAGRKSRAKAD